MATWAAFTEAAPDLASFGEERILSLGQAIGYLATIRHDDGGPRVHPVCLIFGAGRIFVSIARRSPKNADLRADGRYMVHAFPADEDAEFSIRGTAQLASGADRELAARSATFATGVGEHEDVFELDIDRADATTWERWNTPQTRPVRRSWSVRD